MANGSALAQDWTLERDLLIEQPKPYMPCVDQQLNLVMKLHLKITTILS
jgi:hypothetical protein